MTPFNLSAALSALSHPKLIEIKDTTGHYEGGEWIEEADGESRKIRAVVLQLSLQQLEILAEGNASNGGIALLTKAPLYWSDMVSEGGMRQSHVHYMGYVFRVIGSGFTLGNANFQTYNAIRYHDA